MNPATLQAVTRHFTDLDLSEENRQIAELEQLIIELNEKREKASTRTVAIGRELREYRGPDGRMVADALLADQAPGTAALAGPSVDALEAEKTALLAGASELHRRAEAARRTIEEIKEAARNKVAPLAAPLMAELNDRAIALAEEFYTVYAAIASVAGTTRTGGSVLRAAKLVVGGIREELIRRGDVDAPPEIIQMLRALEGKGTALKVYIRSSHPTY